jgi:hypothetical protein
MVGLLATLSCTSYFSKPAIHRIHIELTMLSSHVKFNIISVSFIFRKVKYDLTECLYKTFHV